MKRTELPRAEALCARYLDKNRPVLAAVSGGLDSMCLLHFLRGEGYDVSCAHFNHQLRGEEAARDEDFVRAWCEKEDIPFYLGTGDVRAHARATGKTEEEAARDLRYAFLRETAQMLGAQIALAHHADDNAETVLLNFVRGTDLRGLCGMRPKQGDIVRPFLEQTREELVTYARAHNIPHVEDHTNADPNAAARNYLRLEILPRLRELNPRAPQHIATTARSLTALDDALEQAAEAALSHAKAQDGGISLSLDCFLAADEVVQPRILLHLADALGLGRKDIGRKQLDAICALAQRGGSAERRYTLPQSATVRITDGALTMAFSPAALPKAALVENVPLPWGNFELTLLHKPDGEGISLRVPEDGEIITVAPCDLNARLMLQGANGARSVKRLCVDRKLSLTERDALPALYVAGLPPCGGWGRTLLSCRKAGTWRASCASSPDNANLCDLRRNAASDTTNTNKKKVEKKAMAKSNMDQDILKVLYSEEQLKTRVQEMGDELYERLKGKNPLFLGVLKGSFIFMADIVRACQLKSDIEFIAVSSYQNATTSSGVVQITRDLQQDITGRDIVVIEDILDSGNTLYFLKNYFMTKGASSVTVVTLLDKPARRTKPIAADLAGFEVPDEFVVGYGLDYAQKYRNMPYIGVLKPEVYSEN